VTECSDGSYCCGLSSTGAGGTCCQTHQGVFLVDGKVLYTNPTSTGSAVPLVTATASVPLITSSATPNSAPSTGAIAGGVVGGVAGLTLVIGAIWCFLVRSRRKRGTSPSLGGEGDANAMGQNGWGDKKDIGLHGAPTQEIGGTKGSGYLNGGPVQEMENPERPHELVVRGQPRFEIGGESRFEIDGQPQYRRFE